MSRAALMFTLLIGVVSACGDEPPPPADGQARDAARDAVLETSVPDASVSVEDAARPDASPPPVLVECSPFVEGTCPEREKCSVVRLLDDAEREVIEVRFACTASGRDAEEGATCARAVDATPTSELDHQVTDNCAHGLGCLDQAGLSFPTCQRLCVGRMVSCGDRGYCMPYHTGPEFGVCAPVDDCDPVYQRYCPFGFTCYPVTDTSGDLRSICLRYRPEMTGEGDRCDQLTHCSPSTTCVESPRVDGGVGRGDCRNLCDYHGAYIPETLGEGPGGCPSATDFCVGIELDPGAVSRLPVEPGLCR